MDYKSPQDEKRENTAHIANIVGIVVGIISVIGVLFAGISAYFDWKTNRESYVEPTPSSDVVSFEVESTDVSSNGGSLISGVMSVGSIVRFGEYEQDGDESNGKETLDWRVLSVKDDRALLITEYLIDYMQYYDLEEDITWKDSKIQEWLDSYFFNMAFSPDEQDVIITSTLSNPNNPTYGTYGGSNTQNKVFLLSLDEVQKYFSSNAERKAYCTTAAKAKGYPQRDDSDWWWLRSPGKEGKYAASVRSNGKIDEDGIDVRGPYVGIRPAIWVSL